MKTQRSPFSRFRAVSVALLCLPAVPGVSAGAAPTAPPPAPIVPKYLAFSDEVAGRRLLFVARDSYRNAPAVRVTGRWTLTGPDGTTSGTETIAARLGEKKFAMTTETDGGAKTVRRAVANGAEAGNLLVTRYQDAAPNPTRQFFRVALDEVTPLSRALALAQFAPATKAGELLLAPTWRLENAATVYVSRLESGGGAVRVIQTDLPDGGRGQATLLTRRYTLDTKTNRLRRYEEWRTARSQPRPNVARRPANNGTRATYRREDYAETTGATSASAFSQSLPAGYAEQTPPKVNLGRPQAGPENADQKALVLMRRWATTQERFLTLNAVADVQTASVTRTETSRPLRDGQNRNGSLLATLWLRRPGRARVVVNRIDPATGQPSQKADALAVASGTQVLLNDYANGRSRTLEQRDPADAPLDRLRRIGLPINDNGLAWIIGGPPQPDQFSSILLDGSGAAPVLVLTRTGTEDYRQNRDAQTKTVWRVTLGPDNLPREILSRRETSVSGMFERDQPPIVTTALRLRRISVDSEPLPDTFILPQEITRR
ncbi:MAG: hypothetical protein H7Z41_04255 [Cytophagales bacterium]|nr:hypothetical protein [Armatimonadota bacterium]